MPFLYFPHFFVDFVEPWVEHVARHPLSPPYLIPDRTGGAKLVSLLVSLLLNQPIEGVIKGADTSACNWDAYQHQRRNSSVKANPREWPSNGFYGIIKIEIQASIPGKRSLEIELWTLKFHLRLLVASDKGSPFIRLPKERGLSMLSFPNKVLPIRLNLTYIRKWGLFKSQKA